MWIVEQLQVNITVNGVEYNLTTDDVAGFLVVYKTKEEAEKQAELSGCGITEISRMEDKKEVE